MLDFRLGMRYRASDRVLGLRRGGQGNAEVGPKGCVPTVSTVALRLRRVENRLAW